MNPTCQTARHDIISTFLADAVVVTIDCPNKCGATKALMASVIRSGLTPFTCLNETCGAMYWAEAVEPDTCFVGWCGLSPSHDEPCSAPS